MLVQHTLSPFSQSPARVDTFNAALLLINGTANLAASFIPHDECPEGSSIKYCLFYAMTP